MQALKPLISADPDLQAEEDAEAEDAEAEDADPEDLGDPDQAGDAGGLYSPAVDVSSQMPLESALDLVGESPVEASPAVAKKVC